MSELHLTLNQQPVGTLRAGQSELSFAYTGSWLHHPDSFALGAGIPLLATPIYDTGLLAPIKVFVSASLPPAGQWRQTLCRSAGLTDSDNVGLLAHFGREGQGAISWQSPNTPSEQEGRKMLSLEEIGQCFENPPPAIGLLPGNTPKISVIEKEGGYGTGFPSTLILKGHHGFSHDRAGLVGELVAQTLANHIGLPAILPKARYWGGQNGFILEVPRFDRLTDGIGRLHRLCTATASQLLGEAPRSRINAHRLSQLEANVIPPLSSRRILFQWIVFNHLIGSETLHLDKLAVIRWRGGWRLAPFIGTSPFLGNSQELGERFSPLERTKPLRYADMTADWLAGFGMDMGMQQSMAYRLIERVGESVATGKSEIANTFNNLHSRDRDIAKEILDGVLPYMLERLL